MRTFSSSTIKLNESKAYKGMKAFFICEKGCGKVYVHDFPMKVFKNDAEQKSK